jgi:hypothetical protein
LNIVWQVFWARSEMEKRPRERAILLLDLKRIRGAEAEHEGRRNQGKKPE